MVGNQMFIKFEKWAGKNIIEDAKKYDKDEAHIMDNFDVDEGNLKKLFQLEPLYYIMF